MKKFSSKRRPEVILAQEKNLERIKKYNDSINELPKNSPLRETEFLIPKRPADKNEDPN